MKFATVAAVAAIAITSQFGSQGTAQAETLKVSTFLPPKHTFNRMLEAWGEELKEKSGGELTVEIFPAGQLGPPPRQFDLVKSGAADVSVVLHRRDAGPLPDERTRGSSAFLAFGRR